MGLNEKEDEQPGASEALRLQSGSATFRNSQVNTPPWPSPQPTKPKNQGFVNLLFPENGSDDVPPGMTLQAMDDIIHGIVDDDEGPSNEARAVLFCGDDAKYSRVMDVAKMLDQADERGRKRQETKDRAEVLRAHTESDRLLAEMADLIKATAPQPIENVPLTMMKQGDHMNTFKPGDVVCLKSGGPKMTIRNKKAPTVSPYPLYLAQVGAPTGTLATSHFERPVTCDWFIDEAHLKTDTFEEDALELVVDPVG